MENKCACISNSEVDFTEFGQDETAGAGLAGDCESRMRCTQRSEVEERIESSKVHWSELTEPRHDDDDEDENEDVAQDNFKVSEELSITLRQRHYVDRVRALVLRQCKIFEDFNLLREQEIIDTCFEWKKTPQEDWAAYSEAVFLKNRGVLYGASFDQEPPSEEDSGQIWEERLQWLQSFKERRQSSEERREFFASLGSVAELKDFLFNMKLVLHYVVSGSTSTGLLNISVSEEFRSSLLEAMKSRNWAKMESMVMPVAAALPRRAAIYEAFIILASLILSAMFQYLMALVDKGGTKTHSSGSREYRSRYTSTVLFLGAYVWIKFREVAPESQQKPSRGLHRKCKVDEFGQKVYYGNYEPRFKPTRSDKPIYVGLYEEEEDARIIYQILAFYYGRAVPGELPLLNGSSYRIPCMTEEEQRLDPESKKEWAKAKAKDVLEEFKRAWSNFILLASLPDPQEVQATGDISMDSSFWEFLLDSQGVQAAVDISNTFPDAGAGCDAQPLQQCNQGDGLDVPVCPSNSSPNVDPGMPVLVVDDSCNDHAATAAPETGASDEPAGEPHNQHHASAENRTNYVNRDHSSVLVLVKELQRQQQLQQFLIQQQDDRMQEQDDRIQQQATQISGLKRDRERQELCNKQLKSRVSELEGEVVLLRSTEPARKQIRVGLSLTHSSQN